MLVPAIKTVFDRQVGHSILAAGIVLAVMIFPTITTVAADALKAVPKECRMAAYGLGSTRWQTIYKIVVPAAAPGIISGIILGLARAFGEALAVAMVIGQTTALSNQYFFNYKDAHHRDSGPDGKRDGGRRDEIRPLVHGSAFVSHFSAVHFPDSPCLCGADRG